MSNGKFEPTGFREGLIEPFKPISETPRGYSLKRQGPKVTKTQLDVEGYTNPWYRARVLQAGKGLSFPRRVAAVSKELFNVPPALLSKSRRYR